MCLETKIRLVLWPLSVRFKLEFNMDGTSRDVIRLCTTAVAGLEKLITISGMMYTIIETYSDILHKLHRPTCEGIQR